MYYKSYKDRLIKILKKKIKVYDENLKNEDWDHQVVYEGKVTAIGCDIRNFNSVSKLKDEIVVAKILQSFITEILNFCTYHDNYIDSFVYGDKIISYFRTPLENDVQSCVSISIWINTWKNLWIKIIKNYYNIDLNFGIGMSMLPNQIIYKYCQSIDKDDNSWTILGNVINQTGKLVSGDNIAIRIDENVYNMLTKDKKDLFEKYPEYYETNSIFSDFNDWIKNEK